MTVPGARFVLVSWSFAAATVVCQRPAEAAPQTVVQPAVRTASVPHDADDPAIWLHPTDRGRSLVLGTDKEEEEGGLYVFALDGTRRSAVAPLDRPNNVDVEYGFTIAGRTLDLAVVTERKQQRLRVYGIDATGAMTDLAPDGIPVLNGQAGEAREPMGIALYKRPRDGAVFAIVSPKTGGATDYLWQYRLEGGSDGRVRGTLVRRFGRFSQRGEIEAIVVDDDLGYVYYSDERFGIRKYHADPDAADAARELAVLGLDDHDGDREGLAIYAQPGGRGYLVSSDQIANATRLHIYPREGSEGGPHAHPRLATIRTTADATDGLDVTSAPLPGFPAGVLVMMNSRDRNFLLFDWRVVANRIAIERGPR